MLQSSNHLKLDSVLSQFKWPPEPPDLNPIEHLWDVVEQEIHIMDEQPTNLQQMHDVNMDQNL